MKSPSKYEQLQPEDRMTIASMKQQGCRVRTMGRKPNRPASTISRELMRNTGAGQTYGSHVAQQACQARRHAAKPACKLAHDSVTWGAVLTMLDRKWSPQRVAAMLKQVYPNESTRRVSHQTIYTAIYALARGELKRQLIACLRFGKGTRLPRSRGTDRRGPIPDMVSMHVRPPEIEDRAMHGHWEGDFIKGAGNKSSVGVGFKSFWSARVIIAGIETMRMIRKGKLDRPGGQTISTANQFRSLAA